MLATFIIGLREGLEAALIVGIIAAFLRRQGRSLKPMALGVAAAVALSLLVGIGLRLAEQSLPQAAQEGLETVIGAVAVVFVTGMLLWMNGNAKTLKTELESSAAQALGSGSSRALVLMAFLAVLKEGFETAVFLLATLSAATNAGLAALGAVLGIGVAAAIGYGLFSGSMRLNLARFFKVTSVFLLLVAAGLVVSTLGTAREAGWLNAGQQRLLDLSWLAPIGSIRGALFTGVLGIPAYPTVVQTVGWLAYLIPVGLYLYWPARRRPSARAALWVRVGVAAGLVVVATGLALAVRPAPAVSVTSAALTNADGTPVGTVRLANGAAEVEVAGASTTMALRDGVSATHAGVPGAVEFSQPLDGAVTGLPASLTLAQLTELNGGRLPVGFSPQRSVGPFQASWSRSGQRQVWTVEGQLLDFAETDRTAVTLTGGGLTTSRTLTVTGTVPGASGASGGTLTADPAQVRQVAARAQNLPVAQVEARFWGRSVPLVLAGAAALVLLAAALARRRLVRATAPASSSPTTSSTAESPTPESSSNSVRV